MGTYNITVEEFQDKFEEFLTSFSGEGDVTAECVEMSWNNLCEKYGWNDKLIVSRSEQ